ncbi:MAG: hypothetical protein QOI48_1517 [Solirubrobacteraceae bacterium]|nr:hypothetical protein [Solirubrobacteraceae bacterium]
MLDGDLVHLVQEVGDDGQIRGAAAAQEADRILLELVVVLGYARGSSRYLDEHAAPIYDVGPASCHVGTLEPVDEAGDRGGTQAGQLAKLAGGQWTVLLDGAEDLEVRRTESGVPCDRLAEQDGLSRHLAKNVDDLLRR